MKQSDESISKVFADWSRIRAKSLSATTSFLNESIEDSNGLKASATPTDAPIPEQKRKRRFSSESVNDLLFWACHLTLVGISLAIVWIKVDRTAEALQKLLKAQSEEIEIARAQTVKADLAYAASHKAELQRSVDVQTANEALKSLVAQVQNNQHSIKDNQDSISAIIDGVNKTNELILAASKNAELAAESAAGGARAAAGAASVAAARAGAAAATSGRTANVVASKVVTSGDKARVQAQAAALAQKQRQLSKTIQRVRKTGPTFWDKLIH